MKIACKSYMFHSMVYFCYSRIELVTQFFSCIQMWLYRSNVRRTKFTFALHTIIYLRNNFTEAKDCVVYSHIYMQNLKGNAINLLWTCTPSNISYSTQSLGILLTECKLYQVHVLVFVCVFERRKNMFQKIMQKIHTKIAFEMQYSLAGLTSCFI